MKNKILIAVLAVVVVLGGAYYYIFILNAQGKIPVQIRTSINNLIGKKETPPPPPVKPPVPKPVPAVQKPMTSVKKSVQPPVAAAAVQKPVSSVKKTDQQPTVKPEPQKPVDAKTSVSASEKKETPAEVKKTKKGRKSAKKKSIQPRNYKVEYAAESEDEADKIKDELIAKGYHTAKTSERGGKYYVIIMPFTDTWEAEFIQQNVEKDTGRRGFYVRTIR